jgi:hypothetical protein
MFCGNYQGYLCSRNVQDTDIFALLVLPHYASEYTYTLGRSIEEALSEYIWKPPLLPINSQGQPPSCLEV